MKDNLSNEQERVSIALENGNEGTIINIIGDGSCLFHAIAESCKYIEAIPDYAKDYAELRKYRMIGRILSQILKLVGY